MVKHTTLKTLDPLRVTPEELKALQTAMKRTDLRKLILDHCRIYAQRWLSPRYTEGQELFTCEQLSITTIQNDLNNYLPASPTDDTMTSRIWTAFKAGAIRLTPKCKEVLHLIHGDIKTYAQMMKPTYHSYYYDARTPLASTIKATGQSPAYNVIDISHALSLLALHCKRVCGGESWCNNMVLDYAYPDDNYYSLTATEFSPIKLYVHDHGQASGAVFKNSSGDFFLSAHYKFLRVPSLNAANALLEDSSSDNLYSFYGEEFYLLKGLAQAKKWMKWNEVANRFEPVKRLAQFLYRGALMNFTKRLENDSVYILDVEYNGSSRRFELPALHGLNIKEISHNGIIFEYLGFERSYHPYRYLTFQKDGIYYELSDVLEQDIQNVSPLFRTDANRQKKTLESVFHLAFDRLSQKMSISYYSQQYKEITAAASDFISSTGKEGYCYQNVKTEPFIVVKMARFTMNPGFSLNPMSRKRQISETYEYEENEEDL